jgi:hypothetical protein
MGEERKRRSSAATVTHVCHDFTSAPSQHHLRRMQEIENVEGILGKHRDVVTTFNL